MYQYQDMNELDFEVLAVQICKQLLGSATQSFSSGPDGGRDGKFVGTANEYPSRSKPWEGVTIIQAKHTAGINSHFLESGFFSETSENSTLSEEVVKIKKLIAQKELDNYMLFANRKLTGGAEPTIKSYISNHTGLSKEKIGIFGIDDLDNWLNQYKYIVEMVKLSPLTMSPIIHPDDIAEIIPIFANVFDESVKHKYFSPVNRTSYKEKNQLNNMSEELAKSLRKNYMSYAFQVEEFLNDPQNAGLQDLYQNAIEEFQQTFIIPRQREVEYFDDVFNQLISLLINRDYILRKNKRLTRILVFYMYYNCDIGRSNDD
jgi:hypothetical protein